MKILVVGAKGQVGRELRSALGCLVAILGERPQVKFSSRDDLDLTDLPRIPQYLDFVSPDIIVNAAAYTDVDMAEGQRELAFLVNEAAVRELALFCEQRKRVLIHISTDYVFDGHSDRPYVESDPVGPSGVYGYSKLAGERIIRKIHEDHVILRTSWVFGTEGGNFVKTMLRLATERNELRVVADQYGAPTSSRGIAETVAGIIARLMSEPKSGKFWGTYHYSGLPYVSWAEFAEEIFKQATYRQLISYLPKVYHIGSVDFPTTVARPTNSRLDCSKLKSVFGIEPDDWRRSLGVMLDELKKGMGN